MEIQSLYFGYLNFKATYDVCIVVFCNLNGDIFKPPINIYDIYNRIFILYSY